MAHALRGALAGFTHTVKPVLPKRAVRARADPKVVREYREADDQVVVPGKPADASLYVDEAMAQQKRKNSSLSPEMKARLRKEYTSLGGAENTVFGLTRYHVLAATLLEEEQEAGAPSSSGTVECSPLATARLFRGTNNWTLDPEEGLRSTWEHRAWTAGSCVLMVALLAEAVGQVHSLGDGAAACAAIAAAYVLADLGTGVYHWAVDNYGDASTPLVGSQIAAFQGHHQRPWTITRREFCNNVHQVFKPAAVPAAALLAVAPWQAPSVNAFNATFLFLICMSQQFHAWSHMKKSELPAPVLALQDCGFLIGRKAHGAHHKPNFDGNYCIVSGLWNGALDGSGFFRALERLVASATGVEPRCWYPPQHGWTEQAPPPTDARL